MSPRPREDDDQEYDELEEVTEVELPDRTNGAIAFDMRTTFRVLFYDPAVRNYLIAALSALAMIFLVMFQQGSDIGGVIIVLLGVGGVMLRWVVAPTFILIIITYFMVFPFGTPGLAFENRWEVEDGHFRVVDIVLALAVLVYCAAQYRLFGLVSQAMAFEGSVKRHDEPVTRRPPALIKPLELAVLLGVAGAIVAFGQLVWLVVTSVEVRAGEPIPFEWAGSRRLGLRDDSPGAMPPNTTRFLVLVGLLFFSVLVVRLVFSYWRLRMMTAAEGGMIVLDGGWDETRRERSRLEKWRIWGRKRTEAKEKAAEAEEKKAARREEPPAPPEPRPRPRPGREGNRR